MIGKTISHYHILEKLGEGGMGVVYKAEDTKLKRTVALKFLPHHLLTNKEDRTRFLHEAQSASALNHPNIMTIHEIDEFEGEFFIAMELVEGDTLKDKVEKGPLKTKELLNIAIAVADGLNAAHEQEIVHRDIKSGNIMISNTGLVKIMDFGLAKRKGMSRVTKAGSTLGTLAYMSPEQAEGLDVDRRSDLFSFGVVMYEMATGQLPFKGKHDAAILYSIVNEAPLPVTTLNPNIPQELGRIIHKALEKEVEDRYQHADDLAADLRKLKKDLETGRTITTTARIPITKEPEKKPVWRLPAYVLAAAVVAFLLVVGIQRVLKRGVEWIPVYQIERTLAVTTAPGLEDNPTWSPDGLRIAYASDQEGNFDIWVRQVAGGQGINLTNNHKGYDGNPAWSPDGEWIAFISDRDGGGIFVMPALGGIPSRITPISLELWFGITTATLCWSPDGNRIAYATDSLYTISASGGKRVAIPLAQEGFPFDPAWSPNGNLIVFTTITGLGTTVSTIWTMRFDGSDPVQVTSGKTLVRSPIWSPDGSQLFFVSDRGGSLDIWHVPINASGEPIASAVPLTVGVGVGAIALSNDGTKLVYSKVVERSNIWSFSVVPDRTLTLDDAVPFTSQNNLIEHVAVSPHGEWIAFDSNQRGNMDIWVISKDGKDLRSITTDQAHDFAPDWSPDGEHIVFYSLRSGNRDIYVTPVAGGAITQLTNHPGDDRYPVWSSDGKEIAFFSDRSGNWDAWLVPSRGGVERQLTFHEAGDWSPVWSPDGRRLAFTSDRTGQHELFLLSSGGGKPTQLSHNMWSNMFRFIWSTDGQTIYVIARGGLDIRGINLWAIRVDDGSARLIMDFRGNSKWPQLGLSIHDGRIYFPLWERVGDLWMAQLSGDE